MIERSKSVVELGYISKELGKELRLEHSRSVIAEIPNYYDSLQLKSKVWARASERA